MLQCELMIDALFGSKTRVKLLHLFLNNPGKSFYVREITRLIDEQINSVRRELANMLGVGVIVSDSADNKLYYAVNQQYEYYAPLHAIFADERSESKSIATKKQVGSWEQEFATLTGLRLAVAAGHGNAPCGCGAAKMRAKMRAPCLDRDGPAA